MLEKPDCKYSDLRDYTGESLVSNLYLVKSANNLDWQENKPDLKDCNLD